MAKARWKIEQEERRAELDKSLLENLESRGMVEDV